MFLIDKIGGVIKARTQYGWHVVEYNDVRYVKTTGATPPPTTQPEKPKQPTRPQPPTTRPQPDKTAEKATERPRTNRPGRKKDVNITLAFEASRHQPGQDVRFTLEFENASDKIMNIFNPDLWPLGLSGRYDGRLGAPQVEFKGRDQAAAAEPAGGLYLDADAGSKTSRTFRLQDHVKSVDDWPTIRMRWSAKEFFRNLSVVYPQVARHPDYEDWQLRWSRYGSRYERFAVLPRFEAGGTWYARFYFGRSPRNLWVKLEDPGIPGLMDYFLTMVQDGGLVRVPFTERVAGKWIYDSDDGGNTPMFTLPKGWKADEPEAYSLTLLAERFPDGDRVGPKLLFTLGDPADGKGRRVPIGRAVMNKEMLDAVAENRLNDRLMAPVITLVQLYTEEILPARIREGLVGPSAGSTTRPSTQNPQPTTTKPKTGTSGSNAGASDSNPKPAMGPVRLQQPRPMVEIVVNNSVLTVELFEDEAPNTVANFVKLVQDGFYDGLTFHSRSENELNRGWMQGGSPSGTETGTARFTIPDELNESLSHRRGTLAMAGRRDGVANSASCQFFVCFDPQPQLDGKFTIFGRVVTGLEELEKLTPPATIRKATVVRKRDHDYTPKRMPK